MPPLPALVSRPHPATSTESATNQTARARVLISDPPGGSSSALRRHQSATSFRMAASVDWGTLETMPATMRALRKVSPGPGAELVEVPVPEPGEGEILVRVHAASVCGTDLHIYDWNEGAAARIRTPLTFGHELAGHVDAVGPEVHHIQPGTFVAAETHIACGHCSTCRTGRAHICENLRILGVDTDGAFAEYVVIPAQNAWIVGEGIDPDAASIMEPFGNAVHATFGTAGGEDLATNPVAVIGCGPIGLFSVAIARAAGAWKVIAIEPNDERRALASKMGADILVDPKVEDPVQMVLEATNGTGAEVVLEMSGNAAAIDQGTRMLARGAGVRSARHGTQAPSGPRRRPR